MTTTSSTTTTKRNLSKRAIARLELLKRRLQRNPAKYNQIHWCGTQACLAGFCLPKALGVKGRTILTDEELDKALRARNDFRGLSHHAAIYLGIPVYSDSRDLLFNAEWDGEAAQFNRTATDTPEQAVAKACARIDMFIKSDGTV